ncbi:MAG: CDP-6-deoxy-delta-3,4-glucoseen reductase [bacterium]
MPFKVKVQPSGRQFEVNENELILDAALRQGLNFPYGCRNGGCGSCMGTVVSGETHYPGGTPGGISEEQIAEGKALFCQSIALSDLTLEVQEADAAEGITVKKLPARVVTLKKLNHDVMLMELKLPASQRLQFLAGQYIEILLKDGQRRAFSLANPPHSDEVLQLHIRKVPGGAFTTFVFEQMEEKALLRIEGPLGSFYLREESNRPIILMAGGTGFAPIKAIVEHAIETGIERPIQFYWGVRAQRDLYLHDLALSWAEHHPDIEYIPVLSEPTENEPWDGRTGWVHEAVLEDHADLSGFDVYLCGPPPMIQAARVPFLIKNLPEEQIFSDSFEFSSSENT